MCRFQIILQCLLISADSVAAVPPPPFALPCWERLHVPPLPDCHTNTNQTKASLTRSEILYLPLCITVKVTRP